MKKKTMLLSIFVLMMMVISSNAFAAGFLLIGGQSNYYAPPEEQYANIYRVNPDASHSVWGSGIRDIQGISQNINGKVYVVGYNSSAIQQFDWDGNNQTSLSTSGLGLDFNTSLVCGPDGYLYISGRDAATGYGKIYKMTTDGTDITNLWTGDEGGYNFKAVGMSFDSAGNLYFGATSPSKGSHAYKLNTDGTASIFGTGAFSGITGTVWSNNKLFVSEAVGGSVGRISRFSTAGEYEAELFNVGLYPSSIAADPDGNIYSPMWYTHYGETFVVKSVGGTGAGFYWSYQMGYNLTASTWVNEVESVPEPSTILALSTLVPAVMLFRRRKV